MQFFVFSSFQLFDILDFLWYFNRFIFTNLKSCYWLDYEDPFLFPFLWNLKNIRILWSQYFFEEKQIRNHLILITPFLSQKLYNLSHFKSMTSYWDMKLFSAVIPEKRLSFWLHQRTNCSLTIFDSHSLRISGNNALTLITWSKDWSHDQNTLVTWSNYSDHMIKLINTIGHPPYKYMYLTYQIQNCEWNLQLFWLIIIKMLIWNMYYFCWKHFHNDFLIGFKTHWI